MNKEPYEILNELNIDYREVGDDLIFKCMSGIHEDRKPSCRMNKYEGYYHCFVCHSSGNTHTLYKQLTGETLHNGGYSSNSGYDNTAYNKVETKKGDIEKVEGIEYSPFDNKEIRKFLHSIGIYDDNFIYEYEISYTPFSRYKSKHYELKEDEKATAFYKRILIPIYDFDGNLINIEGRAYEKDVEPKTIYPKRAISDWLFNIEKCDPNKPLIVVEGIKDLFKVWNVHKNVVSLFGGNWTQNKIKLLKDKGFEDIIIFIDNDEAGINSANQFDSMWMYDFRICMSNVEGEDPNDMTLRSINYAIRNSEDYGKWLFNYLRKMREDNNDEDILEEFW